MQQQQFYSWFYKVNPSDSNFSQREDKLQNFISHDQKQSESIEIEYQQALKDKKYTHSFLISGDYEKFRNNQEYAIVFENIQDPQTWYKLNTKTFNMRQILRKPEKKDDVQEQKNKKRYSQKMIHWQYKVNKEDKNFGSREDEFMHYVNHDKKQSLILEQEYQQALEQKKQSHSFILPGDWNKDRCKWNYEINFKNLQNPDTWTKKNTITQKERPICRIEIYQEVIDRLTDKQKECLSYIDQNSKKQSDEAQINLQERLKKLNLDYDKIHAYLSKNVTIIVHISLKKYLDYYLKDTKYRNQFETGYTSGSKNLEKRQQWEYRMFQNHYENVQFQERPKYGVLNLRKDPKGDIACNYLGYGSDYLELKPSVRERCTFTSKDSSYDDAIVGNFDYFDHVLFSGFSDNELRACQDIMDGKKVDLELKEGDRYKEVQIHGPLDFENDVLCVHVSKENSNDKQIQENLKFFQRKFNISVKYIEGQPDEQIMEKLDKIACDPDYGNK